MTGWEVLVETGVFVYCHCFCDLKILLTCRLRCKLCKEKSHRGLLGLLGVLIHV